MKSLFSDFCVNVWKHLRNRKVQVHPKVKSRQTKAFIFTHGFLEAKSNDLKLNIVFRNRYLVCCLAKV